MNRWTVLASERWEWNALDLLHVFGMVNTGPWCSPDEHQELWRRAAFDGVLSAEQALANLVHARRAKLGPVRREIDRKRATVAEFVRASNSFALHSDPHEANHRRLVGPTICCHLPSMPLQRA